ncbi:MAG: sodium/glutamate symporter [Planctomycetia bacterium]|nr:sodium/glutamate symporter [Planctomycetia bacterium]
MVAVMSFCGLCVLLLVGKWLRASMTLFQKLYLPSAVIGGIVGLLVLETCGDRVPDGWTAGWGMLPGFLINIVFASLFLGKPLPKMRGMWRLAGPQVCYGQIVAWGMYVVGLGVTGLFLTSFHVPMVFGNLLEIGFEGGHGTVGGLAETFANVGWTEGKDLGLAVATAGMILGIVLGMAMINWAVRRGYVQNIRTFNDQTSLERRGLYAPEQQPPAGKQTVFADSLDSLALHLAVVGMAILVGFGLKQAMLALNPLLPQNVQDLQILTGFPLFPLCMLGGLVVQIFLQITRLDRFVDAGQMTRVCGASLDFLVVSAVASIQLDFITANAVPLLVLIAAGTLWNVACVLFLAPRLFREAWFERGIAEFGQSMGVTATGLLLLRTVDPESKTPALEAFGSKQLFHEPIMGGGFWTSMAIPLVLTIGGWTVWWISLGAVVFWVLVWKVAFR